MEPETDRAELLRALIERPREVARHNLLRMESTWERVELLDRRQRLERLSNYFYDGGEALEPLRVESYWSRTVAPLLEEVGE